MLVIYDTLNKRKKPFIPRKLGQVQMFVCGPTVYDDPHIGHGRSYVVFDVIAKYLTYLGYEVEFYVNITDIDDKIIRRAMEEDVYIEEISHKYSLAFDEALWALGVNSIDGQVFATDLMPEIINQIQRLEEKGFTYTLDDGVYFDIAKFPEHGKLSGQNLEALDHHRIELNEDKNNSGDFVLWKKEKPGEEKVKAVWESPWGRGRPGWHIEDTAITEDVFGPQYDIHGGGIDLIFPHHEAEITQMEAASGKSPLVNYWMHNGHLMVNGTKMSKSLGNYLTINDAHAKWDTKVLRYFFLSAHYRSSLNFTEESVDAAAGALERLNTFIQALAQIKRETTDEDTSAIIPELELAKTGFIEAMNNDFDVAGALGCIFSFVRLANAWIENISATHAAIIRQQMWFWDQILGVMSFDEVTIPEDIQKLVDEREVARAEKNWAKSDDLRSTLNVLGYSLEDTPDGVLVSLKKLSGQ